MAVFVVVHVEDPTSVKTALNKNYRGSYHSLGDRAWLVSARQTARQVATALGFGDAKGTKLSSGLVRVCRELLG